MESHLKLVTSISNFAHESNNFILNETNGKPKLKLRKNIKRVHRVCNKSDRTSRLLRDNMVVAIKSKEILLISKNKK